MVLNSSMLLRFCIFSLSFSGIFTLAKSRSCEKLKTIETPSLKIGPGGPPLGMSLGRCHWALEDHTIILIGV